MYQVIEGGPSRHVPRRRLEREEVGRRQCPERRFHLRPWPRFAEGETNAVVIGGMRGVAVPENAPNKALAVEFAKFLLGKQAQQASLETVGAGVRRDLDISTLSERQQFNSPRPRGSSSPMTSTDRSTPSIRSSRPPSTASCSLASPIRRPAGNPSSPRPPGDAGSRGKLSKSDPCVSPALWPGSEVASGLGRFRRSRLPGEPTRCLSRTTFGIWHDQPHSPHGA